MNFTLDRRALAYWDDAAHSWVAEAGEFRGARGPSPPGRFVLSAGFELTDTVRFDGPGREASRLSMQSTIKDLLADDFARALLDQHIPGFSGNPQLGFASGLSLEQVAASTRKPSTSKPCKPSRGLEDLNTRR